MKPLRSKLEQELSKEAECEQETGLQQQQKAREFGSVEELLKQDAENTALPESIALRLRDSLSQEPPLSKTRHWIRRFLKW
ncbi:MAG: hypothetical protein RLZZ399_1933 [Verrucomicrobiota bacterium]|jgi:rRNA maturation endonuclease Nob1